MSRQPKVRWWWRPHNARFKVWVNGGEAILTLRPDQTLRRHEFFPTDEGWSSLSEEWFYDGTLVHREWVSDGTDCDGRLTRHSLDMWDGHTLNDRGFPDWQEGAAWQRDYTAESMNY